jgi:F0F1-type ATP synthase membrane subunit b/b'
VKDVIILFINMLLIFIICYSFFYKKKEGFGLNDIDNMFVDVKNITKVVGDIPNEINNIDNKLTQQVNSMGNQIEKQTEEMGNQIEKQVNNMGNQIEKQTEEMGNQIKKQNEEMGNQIKKQTEEMGKEIEKKTLTILTTKLGSIFIQIGDIFNKGIVEPILAVFNGIGNIFVQIFNILKEIGNKIISLPNCIFTYAIKETINTFNYLYNNLLPTFLKNIFSFIYRYTLKYVFEFIGYITGYNTSVQKCYGFNVSSQVDNINSSLNNIQSSFKTEFGHLDFSKIEI